MTMTRAILMMVALVLAELTCSLESGMLYVALSSLYKVYGDPIGVGWLITAFTLTAAGSAAVAGRLGDLYGRRTVMLLMLILACAGSTLSAVTTNLSLVIVGRGIQGASMAILPLGFGILRETLDKRNLGLGISVIGATYAFGGGLGVVLGGAIVDHFDWQAIFVASALLALVSFALVILFVPGARTPPKHGRVDLGGLLFAPAIGMVLYGASEGSGHHWTIDLVGILIAGLALLAVWYRHERRQADPLIDVRQLARREVGLANLALAAISAGPLLGPALVLPLLQQPAWTGVGFGVSATMAGIVKLPGNITATLGSLTGGALSRRISVRSIMVAAGLLSALGWFGLAISHENFWLVVVITTILIVPTGTVILALVPQIIIQATPEQRTSESTGLSQVVRAFAKAVGTQIIALCFASALVKTPEGGSYPAESAYVAAYAVSGVLSVVCVLFLFALPRDVRGVSSERGETAIAPGLGEMTQIER